MAAQILQTIVDGLLSGGLYVLVALGMALIMGVMKIINLAHGELMVLAMYATYGLSTHLGIDPYLTVVATIPLLFAIGAAIQIGLLEPLLRVESILPENQVLLTVAIATVLTGGMLLVYGSTPHTVSTAAADEFLPLGALRIRTAWAVVFGWSLVTTFALWLLLNATDFGVSIRAVASDPDAARLMGISVRRMRLATLGLGSALAGIAGTLTLPLIHADPSRGGLFTVKAFIVTILGRGRILGVLAGGLALGLVESLGARYLASGFKDAYGFVLFVGALLLLHQDDR